MGLCRSKGTRAAGCQCWRWTKNSAEQPGLNPLCPRRANWQNFLLTFNFDSLQLWCPLTYRNPQYLFRKIELRLSTYFLLKGMTGLLRWLDQSTPILHHTDYPLSLVCGWSMPYKKQTQNSKIVITLPGNHQHLQCQIKFS